MLKPLVVLVLASVALLQDAQAESLLRNTDAQDRSFESFLPPVSPSVPWLDLDRKTRLPKGDYPVGRNAEVTPFVLRASAIEHGELATFAMGGG